MIGFWIHNELNSLDLRSALSGRLGDAMPAIHHSPVSRQDDRIGQVRLVNQL